jgi:hypothetical protein
MIIIITGKILLTSIEIVWLWKHSWISLDYSWLVSKHFYQIISMEGIYLSIYHFLTFFFIILSVSSIGLVIYSESEVGASV